MDDNKKSVLVAALSLFASELAKNQAEEEAELGKGKGKAREEDIELDIVIQDQIKLCRELTSSISGKGVDQALGGGGQASDDDSESGGVSLKGKGKGKEVVRNFSRKGKKRRERRLEEEEPYVNPFTGLPVVPETGFEPGPSWRPPPPLRVPSKPAPLQIDPFDHLPSDGSFPLSWTEREKPQGVKRTGSVARKAVAAKREASDIALGGAAASNAYSKNPTSKSSASTLHPYWTGATSPLPWEEYRPAGLVSKQTKWSFGSITDIGSKVIKSAANAISGARQPTTQPRQSYTSREALGVPKEPPSCQYISPIPSNVNNLPIQDPQPRQRRPSQETLPPTYESLSTISRRSSTSSVSSIGQSSVVRSPSILSRIEALSPNTTGGSLNPGAHTAQHAWKRVSKAGSSRQSLASQKASSRSPPQFRDHLIDPSIPSVEENGHWSRNIDPPTPVDLPSRRPSAPYGRSSSTITEPKVQVRRVETESSTSGSPSGLNVFAYNAGTGKTARKTKILPKEAVRPDANPRYRPRTSNSPPSFDTAPETLHAAPNSNNPWKDHLTDDETYARALQQEEYKELQMQRDRLLALSIENGTAVNGDVELANYMAREMEGILGAPSGSSSQAHTSTHTAYRRPCSPAQVHTYTPYRPPTTDGLSQFDLDMLTAQNLDLELNAHDPNSDASLVAAMRLQATFDLEATAEDAWEEWKKSNVEECLICGEEHGKDMLLRPCEHGYCEGCLKEGFEGALGSKTPLKCCNTVLDINEASGLSTRFVRQYEEMVVELTSQSPTYCHSKKCGTFLPPRMFVGDVGTCGKCRLQTCRHCRQKVHPGTFCEEDQETKAVKELGRVKGWKTCPGCNHLIERQDGCLHIVCTRCQTAFCYRCSKRWKDCESTCPDAISATHPKI